METHHQYVPKVNKVKKVPLPDEELEVKQTINTWDTLFGGDQLTVARARGAIAIRCGHDDPEEQLTGLKPVVEDWHSRMTLMKVSLYLTIIAELHAFFIIIGYMG